MIFYSREHWTCNLHRRQESGTKSKKSKYIYLADNKKKNAQKKVQNDREIGPA